MKNKKRSGLLSRLWKFQKGQSLFEVVVALGISALIITAIVALVTDSIRNSTFSRNESQASHFAQELTEWLRGQRSDDTTNILSKVNWSEISGASQTWCFPELSWTSPSRATFGAACDADNDKIPNTQFLRAASFEVVHPLSQDGRPLTVIEADVSVSWTDSQGDHKVVNSTSFSDLRQR